MESAINNAMNVLNNNKHLREYVKNQKNESFMFSTDPEIIELNNLLNSDGHSGASFSICMRYCQYLLNSNKSKEP